MSQEELEAAQQTRRIEWEGRGELRGMGFHPPAKALVKALRSGTALLLEREPKNEYDINAVKVWLETTSIEEADRGAGSVLEFELAGYGFTLEDMMSTPQFCLGYVAKEVAADVSPKLAQAQLGAYEAKLGWQGNGKPEVQIKIFGE